MKAIATWMFQLMLASLPLTAHAQIYMCKDSSGRTLTSDRPILECSTRPMRELNNSGVVTREIPAPLTAEEKRKIQQEEERRKAEKIAIEAQHRRDNAIIDRYRNENEIFAARRRSLEVVEEQIKKAKETVTAAEIRLKEAQTDAEPYTRRNAPPPPVLVRKMDIAEQAIKDGKKIIQDREAQHTQIDANFDETLKRYRELTGASVTSK